MARDKWVRTITITSADLETGDWESRDCNPIAQAIARVLRPGAIIYVDKDEYFIGLGSHREWYCLPDQLVEYASRVVHGGYAEELTVEMSFEPWAIVTERSARKGRRNGPRPDAAPGAVS